LSFVNLPFIRPGLNGEVAPEAEMPAVFLAAALWQFLR
jgi:hypothetical protein